VVGVMGWFPTDGDEGYEWYAFLREEREVTVMVYL